MEKCSMPFTKIILSMLKKAVWWHQKISWILAEFLHEATHQGKDKLLTISNQHWWGNFKKTVEIICGLCVTREQHILEKL